MKKIILFISLAMLVSCINYKNASILTKPNYRGMCKECKDYLKNELRQQMISCNQGRKIYPKDNNMSFKQCQFDFERFRSNINCLLGKSRNQIESILGVSRKRSGTNRNIIGKYHFDCTDCPNDYWSYFLELEYNKKDIMTGWLFNSAPTLEGVKHPCIDCDGLFIDIASSKDFDFNNVSEFITKYGSCFYSKSIRYLPKELNLVTYDTVGLTQMLLDINLNGDKKKIILEFEIENLYDLYELE